MRKTRHTRIDPQQVGERSFDHSLLAQAVENSTDLIAMANREGKFVFGNQSFLGSAGLREGGGDRQAFQRHLFCEQSFRAFAGAG